MRVNVLLGVGLIVAQGALADVAANRHDANTHVIRLAADNECLIDDNTTVRCDHLAERLRMIHVRSDAWIVLFVDNAEYETVVATLDSLEKRGFTGVDVMLPINGTNPSSTVKQWIRLRVEGASNHPFAMLLFSTERFKTWREELIVLSPLRYEVIDRVMQARMAQADCKSSKDFRFEAPYDNVISISEHSDDRTSVCAMPKLESCNFLSALVELRDMNWTEAEIQPLKHVRGELRCADEGTSNGGDGESNRRLEQRAAAPAK
jgi:hypothetical protein